MSTIRLTEKRRSHRVSVNIRATYRSSTVALHGHVADLSRNGLFLRSEYLDGEGAEVELEIELPGSSGPLQISGQVVWVDQRPNCSGMGIQFRELEELARRALANFVIEQTYPVLG